MSRLRYCVYCSYSYSCSCSYYSLCSCVKLLYYCYGCCPSEYSIIIHLLFFMSTCYRNFTGYSYYLYRIYRRFLENFSLANWMSAIESGSDSRKGDLALYITAVVFVLFATCFKIAYEAVVRYVLLLVQ